jgi:hypothetical protein
LVEKWQRIKYRPTRAMARRRSTGFALRPKSKNVTLASAEKRGKSRWCGV